MRRGGRLLAWLAALVVLPLHAEDNVLLIQQGPQGFVVWHTEGSSNLPEEELLDVMAVAQPDGGPVVSTSLGPARVYEQAAGILVRLLEVKGDDALLLDRDACGHVQAWHATGATQLTDAELTEIVMSALPGGGKRLTLGDRYVKAFVTRLGVTATLWKVPAR